MFHCSRAQHSCCTASPVPGQPLESPDSDSRLSSQSLRPMRLICCVTVSVYRYLASETTASTRYTVESSQSATVAV